MPKRLATIQKCAWGFAALFLGVYLLDYLPGIMDEHGRMFGLFHMSRLVDLGHLALGALAVVGAIVSARAARIYFVVLGVWYSIDVVTYFISHLDTLPLRDNLLVNLPHALILVAAFWIAAKVDREPTSEPPPERVTA